MATHWHYRQAYVGTVVAIVVAGMGLTACGGTRSTSKSTTTSTSTTNAAHDDNLARIHNVGGGFHGDLQKARPALRARPLARSEPCIAGCPGADGTG
jgi:uncharacterized metal-binding protein